MKNKKYFYVYQINDYEFTIGENDGYITHILVNESLADYEFVETPLIKRTYLELNEYFKGIRKSFDIPIKMLGTPFQKLVWQEMMNISYGETASYKELSLRIKKKGAYQAIGQACHANKILIIIPCHRVVGKNNIGGFRIGLGMKKDLLRLEKDNIVKY